MNDKTLAVVIGRFQPFHKGHAELVSHALRCYDDVLILVGSSNIARSAKNPFTYLERKQMISEWVRTEATTKDKQSVWIAPLEESAYNFKWWKKQVRQNIEQVAKGGDVVVVGYGRDHTSYYLDELQSDYKLDLTDVPFSNDVSATEIRQLYYYDYSYTKEMLSARVPKSTLDFMMEFIKTPEFKNVKEEFDVVHAYKAPYEGMKFPPVFVTADAVIFRLNYHVTPFESKEPDVLVIERKNHPGKGLWALPGGFINQNESWKQCAIRELKEETGLSGDTKTPNKYLPNVFTTEYKAKVYDDPGRDQRGRFITQAFSWTFTAPYDMDVKGGDDAAHALWIPLSFVLANQEKFYADHFKIIVNMIGRGAPLGGWEFKRPVPQPMIAKIK